MKKRRKQLKPATKRLIDIEHDFSNALCWSEGSYKRIPKKDRSRIFGGYTNLRLSEMAEAAHLTGGRIEFLVFPKELDEWAIKRALIKVRDRIIKKGKA